MKNTEKKRFYTVNEFRTELGDVITRGQIYRMISNGDIPIRQIGKKILIDGEWVRSYIATPCICRKK